MPTAANKQAILAVCNHQAVTVLGIPDPVIGKVLRCGLGRGKGRQVGRGERWRGEEVEFAAASFSDLLSRYPGKGAEPSANGVLHRVDTMVGHWSQHTNQWWQGAECWCSSSSRNHTGSFAGFNLEHTHTTTQC